jgi:colanic acid/amylovoran biosynthesis glycosyltransferase
MSSFVSEPQTVRADVTSHTSSIDAETDGTVALFVDRFLPYSQTFIYDEIRAHARYDVDVFCKERLNADRFPFDRYVTPGNWLGERIYENIRYWPRFGRIINRADHALIHAHFGTAALYALPHVIRHDLPFVVTFWGNDVSKLLGSQRFNPKNWLYLACKNTIMHRADLMLCVSNELCEFVRELSGRPDAVRLYHHGIDLARYQPREHTNDVTEIVMVGRFTEKKGHTYALRAFEQLLDAGREAHLTLIGTGELQMRCQQFVHDRALDPHVTFAGVLTPQDVAERLAVSDIALVPSVVARNFDREGSPTVAKEASATGVPVVGTYHAGLPEIVEDGTTGFLVPERNVKALADRLITLVDNPDLRCQLGEAARAKMEREYNLFAQVRELERLYDAVQ